MITSIARVSLFAASCFFAPVASYADSPASPAANDKAQTLGLTHGDWPWWRGPGINGESDSQQSPPLEWSESKNVLWKTSIPGRGYGSVCLIGNQAFLLTSDEETGSQSLLAFDRANGKELSRTLLRPSGGMRKNARSTSASSSPATDGKFVFVTIPNDGAILLFAVNLDGSIAWEKRVGDYEEHQGYGASPAIYQSLVIIASDNKAGGAITAFDRKSGDVAWVHQRPKLPNYPSPAIFHLFGRDQLIMTGCDLVTSLDPATGELLWETEGATTECVITTVTDGEHVFTSGGYPKNHMSAIRADGSKEKAWENDNRLYVPSPLIKDGTLYAVLDAGIAIALEAKTGKELWKKRLNGNYSASPVLVGDLIFATNETGETFIYKAQPDRYEAVGRTNWGERFSQPPSSPTAAFTTDARTTWTETVMNSSTA